jgi:hypothetical protein
VPLETNFGIGRKPIFWSQVSQASDPVKGAVQHRVLVRQLASQPVRSLDLVEVEFRADVRCDGLVHTVLPVKEDRGEVATEQCRHMREVAEAGGIVEALRDDVAWLSLLIT